MDSFVPLSSIILTALDRRASDIHIVRGVPVRLRIDGRLVNMDDHRLTPEDCENYARAIRPVHTTADGDSIYALSLGQVPGDVNVVGAMAAMAMERAIIRAVRAAGSAYGLPGCDAIHGG